MLGLIALTLIGIGVLLVLSREVELSFLIYLVCGVTILLGHLLLPSGQIGTLYKVSVFFIYLAFQLFTFFWRNQSDKF